jgi:hypothetical protein
MSSNIPQWRVGWGNPGEGGEERGGAGSPGHCNMSSAPHLQFDIIIIIIIIIINMGSYITCTINCNYRTPTVLNTQQTWIVSGTQLKIFCIKEINNNNNNPTCNTV